MRWLLDSVSSELGVLDRNGFGDDVRVVFSAGLTSNIDFHLRVGLAGSIGSHLRLSGVPMLSSVNAGSGRKGGGTTGSQ